MSPGPSPPTPQAIVAPLTRAAVFLVLCVEPSPKNYATVRALCADLPGIFRAVNFRHPEAGLSSVVAFGLQAWDGLFGSPRPAELHTFKEIHSGVRHAISTPGDLLFHIRAKRMDMCFELTTQIMTRLSGAASATDETHGFRYFDNRDLLGFVDGTENPSGETALDSALVGAEDAQFCGGSYVITQKYIHDLSKWNALTTEEQERIIGRQKVSDIEFPDAAKAPYAHNVLTTINENGRQVKIVRDNMPFGRAASGEFGTYFIGYCRSPQTTEKMLENMFVGDPPGNYDRLLDFSHAVTGNLFFAPSATFIEALGDD
jgi:porphyrinogen peroxidase